MMIIMIIVILNNCKSLILMKLNDGDIMNLLFKKDRLLLDRLSYGQSIWRGLVD